jgi:hypothetical protein
MKFHKIGDAKIPQHFALVVVTITILSVSLFEWRALYNLDHPKPYKVGCIGCHSDKKTLKAMADKAGDDLYLVHSGELTIAQLNTLTHKQKDPLHRTSDSSGKQ